MKTPSPKVLLSLLIIALLGLIAEFYWASVKQDEARHAMEDAKSEHAREVQRLTQGHEQAMATLSNSHDQQVKLLTDEYEKKLDGLRLEQRKGMATAFKEFESIFEGNRKTIDYLGALEARVKAGQSVSKAEVEKLAVIATGISFLQKEYQKPFEQFRQLETFFAKQTTNAPAEKPKSNFGFFKRMFNKDFREAERAFDRAEGARQAMTEAQTTFNAVYASAQKQMAGVRTISDGEIKKLYALIDEKNQANAEDLSSFFTNARDALRTHQEVLDFTPETKSPEGVKPQP